MLSNVVDVDEAMVATAASCEAGGAIFVDFRAAFPSISQGFMHEVLASIGIPPHILHLIQALYANARCELVVGSKRHAGFALTAGIRQGCPLSPLIFATVGDLWLRRMRLLT